MLLPVALLVASAAPSAPAACPGSTTIEVNACRKQAFDRADAQLNRYYQAAVSYARQHEPATIAHQLVKSQRSWLAYRDAECGAVFDRWGGGTIRVSMDLDCRTRLTENRTLVLWNNWLTFVDSTPPILPRPVPTSTS